MNKCELCQKNPCQCADKFNEVAKKIVSGNFGGDTGIDADYEQVVADADEDYKYKHDQINETSNKIKPRAFDDILIEFVNEHYEHDTVLSRNDFDTYCLLAEETFNQENKEG